MIGDNALESASRARTFSHRQNDPRDPKCPMHLRRICGTCAHFDGHLRQAGRALCKKFDVEQSPSKGAKNCKQWVRK